jgi:hypothetical protein
MNHLLLVIVGFLSARMVVVSSTSVEAAYSAFSDGLKNLVNSEGTNHASKHVWFVIVSWNGMTMDF